jgi:hypothetical protein
MSRIYRAKDYVEHPSAEVMEGFGNFAGYSVITGCEVTYSSTDMVASISAGQVLHSGSRVTVAAGTTTLVADGTHPRWTWVGIDSAGAVQINSGTAAANPMIPAIGDYVPLALIKVEAAQPIASDCATRLYKGMMALRPPSTSAAVLGADYVTTSDAVTVIPNFSVSLAANTKYAWRATLWYTEVGSGYYIFAVTPSGSGSGSDQNFLFTHTDIDGTATVSEDDGSGDAFGFGASTPGVVVIEGVLVTGDAAGQLVVRTRKSPSGTSSTTKAKSRLEVF